MQAKNILAIAATVLAGGSLATASDLDVRIVSGGQTTVFVGPGESVGFNVMGELSDAQSQGLAMFALNLSYDGGDLAQLSEPAGGSMDSFTPPAGLTNPAGYGGLDEGTFLRQVGGAQNTIKNQFAPIPTGDVVTGIALGGEVVLATGQVVAPMTGGTYTVEASAVMANVIRLGASDVDPFWAVDAAGSGTVEDLIIIVMDCPDPVPYCTGKTNSQGCLPAIGWAGSPTLSGPDDFHLTASDVINNQFGLAFWGLSPDNAPFYGGIRCVDHPIVRTPNQFSGGSQPPAVDCSGTYDYHFTQSYMTGVGLNAGTTVYAQYWYRDPMHPDGTGVGLTNAVEFSICP